MELLTNTNLDEVDKEIQDKVSKYVDWKLLEDNHFIKTVEAARNGSNVGIGNGMPRLSQWIYGTHKARYYLLGADSGAGKTTLSDFMFALSAYQYCKKHKRKLYIIYYSFEVSKQEKKARWVSYYIHKIFNRDIPSDYIMGRIPGMMVSDKDMECIRRAYVVVEQIFEAMIFVEDPQNPTNMLHAMVEGHYESIGTVLRHKSIDPKKKGRIYAFKPKNEEEANAVTIKICDHLALSGTERGFDTKQTMDLWSKYDVFLRNLFGTTIVNIQQFNTEMVNLQRTMKKGEVPHPQRIDFGDSRYTFRDADVVMGLLQPFQFEAPTYKGYEVNRLRTYMLMLFLMKNRYGSPNRQLPIFLNPIAGIPYDLPLEGGVDIVMENWYKYVSRLEETTRFYTPKEIDYGHNIAD